MPCDAQGLCACVAYTGCLYSVQSWDSSKTEVVIVQVKWVDKIEGRAKPVVQLATQSLGYIMLIGNGTTCDQKAMCFYIFISHNCTVSLNY